MFLAADDAASLKKQLDQLKQDGLRLSWLLPTDQYIETGIELGNGQSFPAGGSHSSIGDWAVFARTGGDIDFSHSMRSELTAACHSLGHEASAKDETGESVLLVRKKPLRPADRDGPGGRRAARD